MVLYREQKNHLLNDKTIAIWEFFNLRLPLLVEYMKSQELHLDGHEKRQRTTAVSVNRAITWIDWIG